MDVPAQLQVDQYRVLVPGGTSLVGALVTALLENLNPDTPVAMHENAVASLRQNDVLIERTGTGRKLVVFGSNPTRAAVSEHLNSGVISLIGIDASRPELLAAITSLDDGPAFVSSSVVRTLAGEGGEAQPLNRLTAREKDVLKLVVRGLSNREIADQLFVSSNTVRSHLQSISSKLGISSRAKLAAFGRDALPR